MRLLENKLRDKDEAMENSGYFSRVNIKMTMKERRYKQEKSFGNILVYTID